MRKLYIVDPQNDFMDDGSLPVIGSRERMKLLASYLDHLELDHYQQILVSLDWHPYNHCSFLEQDGPWPKHCVSFTEGALIEKRLMKSLERWRKAGKIAFITKGCKLDVEEYSGVDDVENEQFVRAQVQDIDCLDICGVVGTVCVQNTIQGIIDKGILPAAKINVLAAYTAQFDVLNESKFLIWVIQNGCQYTSEKVVEKHRRYLVFDTETGGLDPIGNDVLQLSYQIIDGETWEKLKEVNHYFDWPIDDLRVSSQAIHVNGLTQDYLATKKTSNRHTAIEEFLDDVRSCDGVVGHNITFDYRFMIAEAERADIYDAENGWPKKFDTMKDTKNLCRLPSTSWNRPGFKNPKLSELADFLNIDYKNLRLHDSSADVELTAQCFRKLCERGHYKL